MLRRCAQDFPGGRDADAYAYSKVTCINASREVLCRFLSLHSVKLVVFFCRSIEFFVLLASMTLSIAHLDSHRREQEDAAPQNSHDVLVHQRLSDRVMMERVLEAMDDAMQASEDDLFSKRSMAFLRRMLAVEEAAAEAARLRHHGGSAAGATTAPGSANSTHEEFRVWVPHLGLIRISRGGIMRLPFESSCPTAVLGAQMQPEQSLRSKEAQSENGGRRRTAPPKQNSNGSPACLGADFADFEANPSVQVQSASTAAAGAPTLTTSNTHMPTGLLDAAGWTATAAQNPGDVPLAAPDMFNSDGSYQIASLQPGLDMTDAINDWTLQGIDPAIFESGLMFNSVDGYFIPGI